MSTPPFRRFTPGAVEMPVLRADLMKSDAQNYKRGDDVELGDNRLTMADSAGVRYAIRVGTDGAVGSTRLSDNVDLDASGGLPLTGGTLTGVLDVRLGGAGTAGGAGGILVSAPGNGSTDVDLVRFRAVGGTYNPAIQFKGNESGGYTIMDATGATGTFALRISTGGTQRLEIGSGAFKPLTDGVYDLGTTTLRFDKGYFESTVQVQDSTDTVKLVLQRSGTTYGQVGTITNHIFRILHNNSVEVAFNGTAMYPWNNLSLSLGTNLKAWTSVYSRSYSIDAVQTSSGSSYTPNASYQYHVVTVSGSTCTIGSPTNSEEGRMLMITVNAAPSFSVTVTFNDVFETVTQQPTVFQDTAGTWTFIKRGSIWHQITHLTGIK